MSDIQSIIISLPRCGQHMTERLLSALYDYYDKEYSYCSYYDEGCCKTIPCSNGKLFVKNHDFKGYINIDPDPNTKYLVLYRADKLDQLEAWFRFKYCDKQKVESSGLQSRPKPDYNKPEVFEALCNFVDERKDYYDSFVDKWVNTPHDNVLCLKYKYLVHNTVDASQKMLEFFNPGETFNSDDIVDCLEARDEKIESKYEFDTTVKDRLAKLYK